MDKKSRRKFTADFKTKVILEALKERSTTEDLAAKYELHPNQIHTWKKEFLNNATKAFSEKSDDSSTDKNEADVDKLYARIGRLEIENDFLKKKLT